MAPGTWLYLWADIKNSSFSFEMHDLLGSPLPHLPPSPSPTPAPRRKKVGPGLVGCSTLRIYGWQRKPQGQPAEGSWTPAVSFPFLVRQGLMVPSCLLVSCPGPA